MFPAPASDGGFHVLQVPLQWSPALVQPQLAEGGGFYRQICWLWLSVGDVLSTEDMGKRIARNAWIGLLLLAVLSWTTNREHPSALVPMICLALGMVGALMSRHDLGATRAAGASWEYAAFSIAIAYSLFYPCLGPWPILPLLLLALVGYLARTWLRIAFSMTGPEQVCFLIGFLACSFLFVVTSSHNSGLEAVVFTTGAFAAWPIAMVSFVMMAVGKRWLQWH